MSLEAIQHVRRMRGGAQSHLMRCSDGQYYVVKFMNNPQHLRVLANEMLATRLAEQLGLPVAVTEVVEVNDSLIEHSPELHVQLAHGSVPCQSGLHFGSRYVVNPWEGQVWDYIPVAMLGRVRNLGTFVGMLAFDKWTGNADKRQAAFWKGPRKRKYTASFIDQGYCFNAGEWNFPDYALRGVFPRNEVYESISGWASFDPWLPRIEDLSETLIWKIANVVPPEWYAHDSDALEVLIRTLLVRRAGVRNLIHAFGESVRRPFPMWRDA